MTAEKNEQCKQWLELRGKSPATSENEIFKILLSLEQSFPLYHEQIYFKLKEPESMLDSFMATTSSSLPWYLHMDIIN